MRISYPICQWCHTQLISDEDITGNVGFGSTNFFEKSFINRRNFCNNDYCEERYCREKNKTPSFKNKFCAFCYTKSSHFSWNIDNNSFCNGRCVDLFNETITNQELRDLKFKEKQLRDDLDFVEKSIKDLLKKISIRQE